MEDSFYGSLKRYTFNGNPELHNYHGNLFNEKQMRLERWNYGTLCFWMHIVALEHIYYGSKDNFIKTLRYLPQEASDMLCDWMYPHWTILKYLNKHGSGHESEQ